MSLRARILVVMMVLFTCPIFAAGLLVTSSVGGTQIEEYKNNSWIVRGDCPRLFVADQYSYYLLRFSAPGYQTQEVGFELKNEGTTHVNIQMLPDNPNPEKIALFAFAGQLVSKKGLSIFPGQYKVYVRNITTHVKNVQTQKTTDENPNQDDGWYSCTLADMTTNRAVAVGDKVFVGAFNSSKTKCFGYVYHVVTEEDINMAYFITDIKVP